MCLNMNNHQAAHKAHHDDEKELPRPIHDTIIVDAESWLQFAVIKVRKWHFNETGKLSVDM